MVGTTRGSGSGQTRRHHTQNNAHCYRHGGGERYFPIVKGSLGWVERGKSCKVAELRSSMLTSGHRREGPGGGCPYAREATQHRCSCIRAAQSPSGFPSEGRHHLVSHPQGAMHPGNVKGKRESHIQPLPNTGQRAQSPRPSPHLRGPVRPLGHNFLVLLCYGWHLQNSIM